MPTIAPLLAQAKPFYSGWGRSRRTRLQQREARCASRHNFFAHSDFSPSTAAPNHPLPDTSDDQPFPTTSPLSTPAPSPPPPTTTTDQTPPTTTMDELANLASTIGHRFTTNVQSTLANMSPEKWIRLIIIAGACTLPLPPPSSPKTTTNPPQQTCSSARTSSNSAGNPK